MARRLTDTYFVEFHLKLDKITGLGLSYYTSEDIQEREIIEVPNNSTDTLHKLIESRIRDIYISDRTNVKIATLNIIDIRPL